MCILGGYSLNDTKMNNIIRRQIFLYHYENLQMKFHMTNQSAGIIWDGPMADQFNKIADLKLLYLTEHKSVQTSSNIVTVEYWSIYDTWPGIEIHWKIHDTGTLPSSFFNYHRCCVSTVNCLNLLCIVKGQTAAVLVPPSVMF